jgi:CarD family transcriptional regulator
LKFYVTFATLFFIGRSLPLRHNTLTNKKISDFPQESMEVYVATKTTKAKAKAKKIEHFAKKTAPAAKTSTSVKVTVKGKTTTVKVPAPALARPAQKPVAPPAKIPTMKTAAAPVLVKKPEKLDFTAGDFVVYPAHGVGQVEGVETQIIAGMEITLYTICFEKDRMRLKLPISKVKASGLRKLSSKDRLKDALATLQGRSQVRRIMWSRRAQEYEAKINSGDPVSIAEVLRDLRKDTDQSEQSYSERQIYQAALERLAREVAAIEKIDEKKAAEKLEAVLSNVA